MSVLLLALRPDEIPPERLEKIREMVKGRQVVVTTEAEEIKKHLDHIEIAAGHFPSELVESARGLRWLQQWGAGADWLMKYDGVVKKDFILTNASGVHAVPISEHILAFLLAFARQLPGALRAQDRHEWRSLGGGVFELHGKILLLVGVGAIGRATAGYASALGMRVWGIRRNPEESEPAIERMAGPDQLLDLLPESDFVVITLPATQETRRMFGAEAFARMKQSAYLVNIGRGSVVDEEGLVAALRDGQIAGAGLDVFETEPLPAASPLWAMPNVILTAHYSGLTPEYHARALDIFVDNLDRYLSSRPMRNIVDKTLGY